MAEVEALVGLWRGLAEALLKFRVQSFNSTGRKGGR
jgi:hypothetical protein